jgi:hypothetical protein
MIQPIFLGSLLCLLQFLAALPWLWALDPAAARRKVSKPLNWVLAVVAVVVAGGVVAGLLRVVGSAERLQFTGRFFGAVLEGQLIVDFFLLFFPLLTLVWPKGGTVALAAFREGVRQPMFWLITAIGLGILVTSPFLPYFTFSEEIKMVRELGYDTTMLMAVVFSVLAASISISDEIEGRTAITVMSKPVARRQFLIGKFIGTLFAALLMTMILAFVFNAVIWFKLWWDRETITNPFWFDSALNAWSASLDAITGNFVLGGLIWIDNSAGLIPGIALGFCQAAVLLAVAVALATRLPMTVNIMVCFLIFVLGHLTPVLVDQSAGKYALINFMARFFANVLPGFQYFDYGPVLVLDVAPDPIGFVTYLGSVVLYGGIYSVIALLFGLILFEDRDLA